MQRRESVCRNIFYAIYTVIHRYFGGCTDAVLIARSKIDFVVTTKDNDGAKDTLLNKVNLTQMYTLGKQVVEVV